MPPLRWVRTLLFAGVIFWTVGSLPPAAQGQNACLTAIELLLKSKDANPKDIEAQSRKLSELLDRYKDQPALLEKKVREFREEYGFTGSARPAADLALLREASEVLTTTAPRPAELFLADLDRVLAGQPGQARDLPAATRPLLDAAGELARLRGDLDKRWTTPPTVERLQRTLAALAELVSDPAARTRLRLEYVRKCFTEGHFEVGRKLLDESVAPAEAAGLLRDLVQIVEESSGLTPLDGMPKKPEPGRGGMTARGPPDLNPLLPLLGADGSRPPIDQPATANLPPLRPETKALLVGVQEALQQRARGTADQIRAQEPTRQAGGRTQKYERLWTLYRANHRGQYQPPPQSERFLTEVEVKLEAAYGREAPLWVATLVGLHAEPHQRGPLLALGVVPLWPTRSGGTILNDMETCLAVEMHQGNLKAEQAAALIHLLRPVPRP